MADGEAMDTNKFLNVLQQPHNKQMKNEVSSPVFLSLQLFQVFLGYLLSPMEQNKQPKFIRIEIDTNEI